MLIPEEIAAKQMDDCFGHAQFEPVAYKAIQAAMSSAIRSAMQSCYDVGERIAANYDHDRAFDAACGARVVAQEIYFALNKKKRNA